MKKNCFILSILLILSMPATNILLADDDLTIYRSKEEIKAFEYAWQLPKERQISLAQHLLKDENGLTVYRGSQLLIKNGKESDSFPALALLIAEGKDKTHLNGRMGYDWVHSDDETLATRMVIGILIYLNENYMSYKADEKERILTFFQGMGYQGKYDKFNVQELIKQMQKQIKIPNNQ